MPGKQPPKAVSEMLCEHVLDCGRSRYRIAMDTGIAQSTLSRFITGERGLSQDAIDTLAVYFGLQLVADEQNRKTKDK